jgi:hypothetical protein
MAEVPEWYTAFVGAVVARLPRDIDESTARGLAESPDALEEALRGLLGSVQTGGSIDANAPFQNDKLTDGWKLLEDQSEPSQISADTIEMALFIEEGEPDLIGEDMVEHVLAITSKLGQRHAEYLIDHQGIIPEEFRRYSVIFPGTIWTDNVGNHYVPYIKYRQEVWTIDFGIVEGGVDDRDRLARPRA